MKLNLSTAALGAALVFATTVAVGAQGTGGSPGHAKKGGAMMMAPMHQITVHLAALNGSGEAGSAVVKDTAAGVSVAIKLTGAPSGLAQPAHIHKGTCAKLDPKPEYPLTSVMNGMSMTVVPGTTVAKLMATPNAINVHKSAKELKVYVSCGDIAKAKSMM
jgi:hypothetical protein